MNLPKLSGIGSIYGSLVLGPEPSCPEPLYPVPCSDCCWSLAAFFFKGTPQVAKACLCWWYCKALCSLYLLLSFSDSFFHKAPKRLMSAADSARLEPFLIWQCCLTKSAKGLQAFGAKPSNIAALRARFGDAGVTATANKESYHDNFARLPRQSAGCKHDNSHDKNSLYGSTALWKESVKSPRGSTAL